MYVAVIKACDVAEVKLYDWKLAVLLWVIVLRACTAFAFVPSTICSLVCLHGVSRLMSGPSCVSSGV